MAVYALSASFRICRNRMAIPSSPIDGKPAMHCVTSQPRLLERQLYEEFPDATSTRERVGSKVVVELHLKEGGTTYRGLGYNKRLALIAACRSSVALLANKMLQISLEGWVFLLLAVGVSVSVLEEEECLNKTTGSTEAPSATSSTESTKATCSTGIHDRRTVYNGKNLQYNVLDWK